MFNALSSRNGSGVFISDIVKGGAADYDRRLMQGDQILSVNGTDVRNSSQEVVATILKVRTIQGTDSTSSPESPGGFLGSKSVCFNL